MQFSGENLTRDDMLVRLGDARGTVGYFMHDHELRGPVASELKTLHRRLCERPATELSWEDVAALLNEVVVYVDHLFDIGVPLPRGLGALIHRLMLHQEDDQRRRPA